MCRSWMKARGFALPPKKQTRKEGFEKLLRASPRRAQPPSELRLCQHKPVRRCVGAGRVGENGGMGCQRSGPQKLCRDWREASGCSAVVQHRDAGADGVGSAFPGMRTWRVQLLSMCCQQLSARLIMLAQSVQAVILIAAHAP